MARRQLVPTPTCTASAVATPCGVNEADKTVLSGQVTGKVLLLGVSQGDS